MSVFEVETGACSATANAYCSVAYADDYHSLRTNTGWTSVTDTAKKQAALIAATTWLDSRYGHRWRGRKQWPIDRVRSWPRVPDLLSAPPSLVYLGIYHASLEYNWQPNSIPGLVQDATAEAALRVITNGPLIPDLVRGGLILSESRTVGPISRSTTYAPGAPPGTSFAAIEAMLAPVLDRGAGVRNVRRA